MRLSGVALCAPHRPQLNKAVELLKAGKPRYRIVMETDI
jgi:hypothetical protein